MSNKEDRFVHGFVRSATRLIKSLRKDRIPSARYVLDKNKYYKLFENLEQINVLLKETGYEVSVSDSDLADYEIRYKAL